MIITQYKIPFENDVLDCTVESAESAEHDVPQVLFINGYGPTSRANLEYLLTYYADKKIGTVRFDFTGQGASTGLLEQNTFRRRAEQALTVIRYLNMKNSTLIGTSMGCFTASMAAAQIPCSNLVLFAPRAYDSDYCDIPFDANFLPTIKTDKQFLRSNIDSLLQHFTGNAVIFQAGKDEGSPEIPALYTKALRSCKSLQTVFIEDSPHSLHSWSKDKPAVQKKILDALAKI